MTTVSWWTAQDSNSNGDRCETVNFTPPEGILLLENMVYSAWFNKSEFVERFPELSLFFKAYSLLDSEMICIFPYFCPYAESAREIREIFS